MPPRNRDDAAPGSCRAFRFVDATDVDANCPINRAELQARIHAREDGMILSGGAGFAAMGRATPLLRPLGLAARYPWVLLLLERSHRGFLRIRTRRQRLAQGAIR